jgi:hypothetical protein
MNRRVLAVGTGLIAALAVAAPATADLPAEVTHECTSFGSLPAGPPPGVGQITVVTPTGHVTTPPPVPGPCSAPGFLGTVPPH